MRRDVFIQNDSGGFSVLAADAAADIVADGRADDMRFVTGHKAMLLELYGDDSMPVRIVIDEALTRDEEAQWLARATWRIDTSDGRLLVMGGFDPYVLADWNDNDSGNDGWGEDSVTWDGDRATLGEPDERTLLLLASAVFRVRFAGVWPMAATEP